MQHNFLLEFSFKLFCHLILHNIHWAVKKSLAAVFIIHIYNCFSVIEALEGPPGTSHALFSNYLSGPSSVYNSSYAQYWVPFTTPHYINLLVMSVFSWEPSKDPNPNHNSWFYLHMRQFSGSSSFIQCHASFMDFIRVCIQSSFIYRIIEGYIYSDWGSNWLLPQPVFIYFQWTGCIPPIQPEVLLENTCMLCSRRTSLVNGPTWGHHACPLVR